MSDEPPHDPKSLLEQAAAETVKQPSKASLFVNLRTNFFAGVVVAAPVGITIWLIFWFLTGPMSRLDAFVKQAIPSNESTFETVIKAIPFLGVFFAIGAIVLLGAFAKNFVGRAFINASEEILSSLPIVRNLYRFFKNVFETALQQSARSFKEVALVEYPSKGLWVMAFVVGDTKGEIRSKLVGKSNDLVSIFVPTVPNPTSGFLIFVPRSSLKPLAMTVEDAAKAIFSIGLVVPEWNASDEGAVEGAREEKRQPFRLHIPGRGRANRNG